MTTLALIQALPRGTQRLRLVFDRALGGGAFSTTLYVVTSVDGIGTSPTVSAAIVVASDASAVELALGSELAAGGVYSVAGTAVPAADATTFTGSQQFAVGSGRLAPSPSFQYDDLLGDIFGFDLVWDDDDLQETQEGDLARWSGPEMVATAIVERWESDPLAWDPSYGGNMRAAVDAPTASAGVIPGRLNRQALLDDRVKRCAVKLQDADSTDPSVTVFAGTLELVGGASIDLGNLSAQH